MNKDRLEGETSTQHRERLRAEVKDEIVEHKRAIIAALQRAGAIVEPPEDLTTDYISETWKVNGHGVELKTTIYYDGSGFFTKPTGIIGFTIGPYWNKQRHTKRSSPAALKKYPSGFNYDGIAEAFLEAIKADKLRTQRNAEESTKAQSGQDVVVRLSGEFGITDWYQSPLTWDSSGIEAKFRRLTEQQARAIMKAAKDAGVVNGAQQEVADGE